MTVFAHQRRRIEKRVSVALSEIRGALASVEKPYVAWSTGKDSMALLDLVRRARPDIDVMHQDSLVELPESYQIRDEWAARWGLKLHIVKASVSPVDLMARGVASPEVDERCLRAPIRRWVQECGYDLVFLGFREDESRGRRAFLRSTLDVQWVASEGIYYCCPLRWWTADDVFGYLEMHELPVHPAYAKTRFQPRGEIRVSWWADHYYANVGAVVWLRYYYPDLYRKLEAAWPAARAYR